MRALRLRMWLMTVLTAASASHASATERIVDVTQHGVPFGPVFVKVVAADDQQADGGALAGRLEPNDGGQTVAVEASELRKFRFGKGAGRERWLMLTVPETAAAMTVAFDDAEQAGEPRKVSIDALDERASRALKLFREADGSRLVAAALERERLTLSASQRAKLLGISASFPDLEYARLADFVLGVATFQELEAEFNNGGPEGCFKGCYEFLMRVASHEGHDPVYVEALRRLSMAQAWSSDYDWAKASCDLIVRSGVSGAEADFAKQGLADLGRIKEQRQQKADQSDAAKSATP